MECPSQMKIYKGWVSGRPAYYIVEGLEVKCIDCLARNEYMLANTNMLPQNLEEHYTETNWLEVLVVTGIARGQVLRVFRTNPELRNSFAFPHPNKEYM